MHASHCFLVVPMQTTIRPANHYPYREWTNIGEDKVGLMWADCCCTSCHNHSEKLKMSREDRGPVLVKAVP